MKNHVKRISCCLIVLSLLLSGCNTLDMPYKNAEATDFEFILLEDKVLSCDTQLSGQALLDSVKINYTITEGLNLKFSIYEETYDGILDMRDNSYCFYEGMLRNNGHIEYDEQSSNYYSIYDPYYGFSLSWNNNSDHAWLNYYEEDEADEYGSYPIAELEYSSDLVTAEVVSFNNMEAIHVVTEDSVYHQDIYISIDYGLVLEEKILRNGQLYFESFTYGLTPYNNTDPSQFIAPADLDYSDYD